MKTYSLLANKIVFSSTLCRLEDDLRKFYVRKEANTIEELCDEFVMIDEENEHYVNQFDIRHVRREWLAGIWTVYGAIWTDKGLIYVAKMNENGEFKLL